MKKYEYLHQIMEIGDTLEADLDSIGKEGWELCGATEHTKGWVHMFFKSPL